MFAYVRRATLEPPKIRNTSLLRASWMLRYCKGIVVVSIHGCKHENSTLPRHIKQVDASHLLHTTFRIECSSCLPVFGHDRFHLFTSCLPACEQQVSTDSFLWSFFDLKGSNTKMFRFQLQASLGSNKEGQMKVIFLEVEMKQIAGLGVSMQRLHLIMPP